LPDTDSQGKLRETLGEEKGGGQRDVPRPRLISEKKKCTQGKGRGEYVLSGWQKDGMRATKGWVGQQSSTGERLTRGKRLVSTKRYGLRKELVAGTEWTENKRQGGSPLRVELLDQLGGWVKRGGGKCGGRKRKAMTRIPISSTKPVPQ